MPSTAIAVPSRNEAANEPAPYEVPTTIYRVWIPAVTPICVIVVRMPEVTP